MKTGELPDTQAILGKSGIFNGKDYRGADVLAYLSPVPGTAWFVVAKVDTDEIFSELYFRVRIVVLMDILLILSLSIGLMWIYHYRQRNIYRQLFKSEKTLSEANEEFRTTLYSIGDAVITTDTSGRVK